MNEYAKVIYDQLLPFNFTYCSSARVVTPLTTNSFGEREQRNATTTSITSCNEMGTKSAMLLHRFASIKYELS